MSRIAAPAAFLRFALAGAAGFFVDVAVLHAALGLGAGLYSGRVVSYLAAASFTWAVNRRFAFASAAAPSVAEWGRYLLANLSGGVVNYALYAVLVGNLDLFAAWPALAVGAGSIAGLGVNFLASSRFVFNS